MSRKFSRLSVNFPEYLENVSDCLKSFISVRKLSRLTRKFTKCPEIFRSVQNKSFKLKYSIQIVWIINCDKWHLVLFLKCQDVTFSPFAQCCTLPDCHLYTPTLPPSLPWAMFERTRAVWENTGGNLWTCSNEEMPTVLHPNIFVTKLGVTCCAVTVTIYDIHLLNRPICYHILKVTCVFG